MTCILSSLNLDSIFNTWMSSIKTKIEDYKPKINIDITNEILFSSDDIITRYGISKISFFEIRNYFEKFQSIKKINTKVSIYENNYSLDFIVLFLLLINHLILSIRTLSIEVRYNAVGLTYLEKDLMSFYGYDYNTVIDKTTAYNTIILKNKLTIGHLRECSPNNKYKTLYFS